MQQQHAWVCIHVQDYYGRHQAMHACWAKVRKRTARHDLTESKFFGIVCALYSSVMDPSSPGHVAAQLSTGRPAHSLPSQGPGAGCKAKRTQRASR